MTRLHKWGVAPKDHPYRRFSTCADLRTLRAPLVARLHWHLFENNS